MNDLIKLLDELEYTKNNHKIRLFDKEADVLTYIGHTGRFVRRIDICRTLVELTIYDPEHMNASRVSTFAELQDDMIDWFMWNVEKLENDLIEVSE